MRGRTAKIAVWGGLAAVVLAAVVVPSVLPASSDDYRDFALSAAEKALSQVRTAELVVTADAEGNVLPPYRSAVLWQARDTLATATSDFTSEEVPDAAALAVHDECLPVLSAAAAEVAAVSTAADAGPDAERALAAKLRGTGDLLAGFLERHR
ncbi:hypothetical protein [Amycolatopsis solani]|uniref:hypothetical protein n=1 Tax=Amycolatopsis solani TaxID=3028615 RepID=UPI0025B23489|nr:hypothetical protein [Amycolatopsis sp. MEP2-6]